MDNSFLGNQSGMGQDAFGAGIITDFNNVDESGNVIVPNKTISTNDSSVVGSEQQIEPPAPPVTDFSTLSMDAPAISPMQDQVFGAMPASAPTPPTPIAEIDDVAKIDFIKTYTREFDETLIRATEAAQKILDSIDVVIRDHSSDIIIPNEANEFLDKSPENNKVQKFDEARAIVNKIIARAEQAKQQSEQAAAEAARIYDDVQQFKSDTKAEIARLTAVA